MLAVTGMQVLVVALLDLSQTTDALAGSNTKKKRLQVLPRFELGLSESKSDVIRPLHYRTETGLFLLVF